MQHRTTKNQSRHKTTIWPPALIRCAWILVLFILALFAGQNPSAWAQTQPGEQWEWRDPLPQGDTLHGVTWGDSHFVAVGEDGAVVTSPDGENWTVRNAASPTLYAVTWGNGLFVAVGAGGAIATSPDGVEWTIRASNTPRTLSSVVWNGAQFVAVGQNGVVATSPDGIAWTARTAGATWLYSVAWGNGRFVAVGQNGAVMTSPDGVTWTWRNSGTAEWLFAVVWSGTDFLAAGQSGSVYVSADGEEWDREPTPSSIPLRGLAWSGSEYVAVGDGQVIITSPNGVDWTSHTSTTGLRLNLRGVAWGGGRFVCVGAEGVIFSSATGEEWSLRWQRATSADLWDIVWGGDKFVAVGYVPPQFPIRWNIPAIVTSPDGRSWTEVELDIEGLEGVGLTGLTWDGSQFVAVGGYRTILTSLNGVDWVVRSTTDWSDPDVRYVHTFSVASGGGRFVAVGYDETDSIYFGVIFTSTDGEDWTVQDVPDTFKLNGVAWDGSQFVAVGWQDIPSTTGAGVVLTSPDGEIWTRRDPETSAWLSDIVWGGNKFVAVGIAGTDGVAFTSWDGVTWIEQTLQAGTPHLHRVVWNGGLFTAVGERGTILTSPNGTEWTAQVSGTSRLLHGIGWGAGQFVAVGEGAILGTSVPKASSILSPRRSGTLVASDTLRFSGKALNNPQTVYNWEFGDGRSTSVSNPGLVSFQGPGTYNVTYSAAIGEQIPIPDTRVYEVVEDSGNIADLRVTHAGVAGVLSVGQPLEFAYTVENIGQGPAGPSWQDALYLSGDAHLDVNDILLGSVAVNSELDPGATYQNTINATLPAVGEGAYHLILSVNDQWQVLELHRLNNEYSVQVSAQVPALTAGTDTIVDYSAGQVRHYFLMTAEEGKSLLLDLTGVSQGFEVYIRFNALPMLGAHDYRLRGGEQFIIPAATAGDWYIMIYGNMNQAGSFTLRYSMEDLALTNSTPSRHGTGMDLQLFLTGTGFFQPLQVTLVSGVSQYAADVVEVDSFTQAAAFFSDGRLTAGTYTVRVSRNGQAAELPGVLEVMEGGQARLETNLILPGNIGYNSLASIYVEYANTGDAAMPAPLLMLTATQDDRQDAILSLENEWLARGFWATGMPQGFASAVRFLASGATPGVLQPGESIRVPVYYTGWLPPWDISDKRPPLNWQLSVLKADDATPVDWAAVKDEARPDYIRADAWDVVWDNFTVLAGNTLGDYLAMLNRNALYLHRQGVHITNVDSLQAFSMRQADGLSPSPILTTGTDAAVHAPATPIVFTRSFLQPISRRFELGDLGRGWTHNWRRHLNVEEDGTVVITGMDGMPRIFNPDSRYGGRYLAQPGDEGVLQAVSDGFRLTEAGGLIQYYRDGKLQYLEDTNGNRITCSYSGDQLTELTHSAGGSLQIAYTGGRITSVADHLGRLTRYFYTGDHLTSVQAYDGRTITYSYNTSPGAKQHALTQIVLPDGTTRAYSYDEHGRLTAAWRDNEQEKVTFTHENVGQIVAMDALGHASRLFFDHRSRLVKSENALNEAVQARFDNLGNLTALMDPAGVSSFFAYDHKGNLTGITDNMRRTARFAYTRKFNRLARIRDAKSNYTNYQYDNQGNLVAIVYPDGESEGWAHDSQGKTTAWTNRRGNAVAYEYDAAGRITRKCYEDGSSSVYTYDDRGNLVKAENNEGAITFTYDDDYLTRVDYPGDRWLEFAYDAAGRRVSSKDQLGYQLNYHYDASGRLSKLSHGSTDIVAYAYDLLGRLSRKTMGNGVYTTYAYDPAGRLLALGNHKPDDEILSRFAFTYDRRGRRTAMETHYGTWAYGYDDSGQLVSAVLVSTDPDVQSQDLTYEYDALGNRIRTLINGQEENYVTNNLNQYTRVGDRTYTYDSDGNLIEENGPDGTTTYTYNEENRLIGVAKGSDQWLYRYDALGNRVALDMKGSVTHHVIDPFGFGNVVGEYDDSGNMITRYTHDFGLLNAWSASDGESYFSFDPLGNVSTMTGLDGMVRNTYAYLPYGEPLRHELQVRNTFTFAGQLGVSEDAGGSYFMRARNYDPNTGRFMAQDPIGILGRDLNLYRYALNNPLKYIDPDGEAVIPIIIGGAAVAGAVWVFYDFVDTTVTTTKKAKEKRDAWTEASVEEWVDLYEDIGHTAENVPDAAQVVKQGADVLRTAYTAAAPGSKIKPPSYGITYSFWKIVNKLDSVLKKKSPVVVSRDPNEKTGVVGHGVGNFVKTGSQLSYRIDFENYASATAPAQIVTIRDPLSADLDWSTFELAEIGFGSVAIQVPPGLQSFETVVDYEYTDEDYDFLIEVHVEAWLEYGTVHVNFFTIDPDTGLPPPVNIGFLMPETDPATGRGRGYASYLIRPRAGLPSGTAIRNVATIQFDFSTRIDTNQVDPLDPAQGTDPDKEALVTFDGLAPSCSVNALDPVTTTLDVTVAWSGADDPSGSGIRGYDVFVRQDGGEWAPWLVDTPLDTAEYAGENGKTYAFYCVATDNVGHREAKDAVEEASTLVQTATYEITVTPAPALGGIVSGGGSYDPGAWVTVSAAANDGYVFVNWTEDGTEVSTAAVYQFQATAARDLTAHFRGDFAGGDGSFETPYQLSSPEQLDNARHMAPGDHFALTADLDLAGFAWEPIGTPDEPFNGIFDGQGRIIFNLTMDQPDRDNLGLFGVIGTDGQVRNLGLSTASVYGKTNVGILAGRNDGLIEQTHADGEVFGAVGGGAVGGLVGRNSGSIARSYATAQVSSFAEAGGLAGVSSGGTISDCYATGFVGGLHGIGGLDGVLDSGEVARSYATGLVVLAEGGQDQGGLIGRAENGPTIIASYWNTETSLQETSAGGIGLTTAQMRNSASFEGWEFGHVLPWNREDAVNGGYPYLTFSARYAITAEIVPDDSGAVDWTGEYPHGATARLVLQPAQGYVVDDASGCNGELGDGGIYTITPVLQPCTVTAAFSATAVETYTLTVNNGSGSGEYEAGVMVLIQADDPAEGKMFDKWTGNVEHVTDMNSPSTTVTMPAANVTVTATYKDLPPALYDLTVLNGSGSGEYAAGAVVTIQADGPAVGKIFDKWTGDVASVANVNSASTTVTMPAANVTVTATYKDVEAIVGDLNGDGIIDRADVNIVTAYRNKPLAQCPQCDIDGDGRITVLDARKLILMCTCPGCVCP